MPMESFDTRIDGARQELTEHGTAEFPIACYEDDLSAITVRWHWHEELQAVFVARGRAGVAVGKEKFTLRAGEGFFVNTGILHAAWNLGQEPCVLHALVFHPRLLGGSPDSVYYRRYLRPLLADHSREGLALRPEVSWQKEALEAVERAWQACAGASRGYEFRVRAELSELVLLLEGCVSGEQPFPSAKQLRDGERVKRMLDFIHKHWNGEIDTGAIAASAAVSESECLRCFRTAVGVPPVRYLRRYRIQQAALLLTTTGLPVAQIAEQCGFQDVSYFTKTFREIMGIPPSAYRREHGGK